MGDEFIYVQYGPCLEGDPIEDWDVESRPPGWLPGIGPYPSRLMRARAVALRRLANEASASNSIKRRRGGQPGNTNALKTGRHSKQLEVVVERLLLDPGIAALIERFARNKRQDWKRQQVAIIEHAEKVRRATERTRLERVKLEGRMQARSART